MSDALRGRRIVLGVGGGIAAYKVVELCRELVRRGAFVSPVLTHAATNFIGAATFSAVASEPARTSLWESPEASPHTLLGQSADLVIVAPATANLLAAARAGTATDLLTTTLLATRAPVLVCPAMHTEMWEHAATVDNIAVLRTRGVHVLEPDDGPLAMGDTGPGRLPDPIRIADTAERILGPRDLEGLHVLVSAGGTREPIDPVRFVGNRSSGKQGHAVAEVARSRGATVTLVTTTDAPARLAADDGVELVHVGTAEELSRAMLAASPRADVVVMAAAVADYRPSSPSASKLKRREGIPEVVLEPTPVVLDQLIAARPVGQTIVGFAAETEDLLEHARTKLRTSGADLVVANDVAAPDTGFEFDTNAVTILGTGGGVRREVTLCTKHAVAQEILSAVLEERDGGARAVDAHVLLEDGRPQLREVR